MLYCECRYSKRNLQLLAQFDWTGLTELGKKYGKITYVCDWKESELRFDPAQINKNWRRMHLMWADSRHGFQSISADVLLPIQVASTAKEEEEHCQREKIELAPSSLPSSSVTLSLSHFRLQLQHPFSPLSRRAQCCTWTGRKGAKLSCQSVAACMSGRPIMPQAGVKKRESGWQKEYLAQLTMPSGTVDTLYILYNS